VTDDSLHPLPQATTAAEWEKARTALHAAWDAVLGKPEMEAPESRIEVLEEETVGRVLRQRVRYLTEPGLRTEAYLLLPREREGRVPAVVVFHSTVLYHIRQPAGLEGPEEKFLGLRLAERGFAALCPRCFIFDPPGTYADAVAALKQRHPRWTGMGKMLWDGRRALDALAGHPAVDAARLASIGHSLGAKETLYLAAFDPRVRAAVFSEGGVGLSFSNWEAPWYLGEQVRKPGFPHDHHELLALCAPRAFLLIGGGDADGDPSRRYVDAARPVYDLYHAAESLRFLNHKQGHTFPPAVQSAAYEWLEGRR